MSGAGEGFTAALSEHARQRAAEMGVCTKRVKQLVRNPDVCRVAPGGRWLVTSDRDPEIAVVYALRADGCPVVVTVLYRTYERYERQGHNEMKEPA